MDEILHMPIHEMPGKEFDCSCGRRHSFSVKHLSIRRGAVDDLPAMAQPFKDGTVLVVFDSNTYPVAGEKAVTRLKNAGVLHRPFSLFRDAVRHGTGAIGGYRR